MSTTKVVYLSTLLRNCVSPCLISSTKQAHNQAIIHGYNSNITLQTDLLLAYSKSGSLQLARQVFDKMPHKNMHSWNIMIRTYVENSWFNDALSVFNGFLEMGFRPDHYTLPQLFRACVGVGDCFLGKAIHGWAVVIGFEDYCFVGCSILDFYLKCGDLVDAKRVFGDMSFKDTVVWNSMISGLGKGGFYEEVFTYLKKMITEGVKMDSMTIPSVLNACGRAGDLMKGKEVHGKIIRWINCYQDTAVNNSLIDMYAKCGYLHYSENIFINMRSSNLVSWTTMISSYGLHGKGEESMALFNKMRNSGFKPNSVTFTAVLTGCNHSGLIDQGRRIFSSIFLEYGIECCVEHYACMVNILGGGGYLDEAFGLIKNMKLKATSSVWGALLAGCVMQKNVEIGEIAAYHLFEIEPKNSSNYIALCSIYDYHGIWDGVSKIRVKMRELGLVKAPGCSWITIEGIVHKFYQGNLSQISSQMILESLDRMTKVPVLPEDFR